MGKIDKNYLEKAKKHLAEVAGGINRVETLPIREKILFFELDSNVTAKELDELINCLEYRLKSIEYTQIQIVREITQIYDMLGKLNKD